MTKQQVLDLYFLNARHQLIEVAAFLDRLERAGGEDDYRVRAFRAALGALVAEGGGIIVQWNGRAVNIITPRAPLGEELLGRKAGDTVSVEAQNETREYEILAIS